MPPDLPLIVVLNHPSWWDPLIGVVVAGLLPERTHYAPMDAKALGRYSLFNKLGFYGVEQGTPRGAAAFLRATTAILSQPRSAVWITAQGEFTDPRVRPTLLRPGVGHIARRLDEGLILTLALEYPFWEERLPEALARFGEPMLIGRRRKLSARRWVELIEADLTATQDALKADALSRNAAAFETLLTGKVAIGGIYDRWRKSCAWLRGETLPGGTRPRKWATVILMLLALIALIVAAIPAWLFWRNLSAYQPPPSPAAWDSLPRVSVLIPARNEEQTIQAAVEAALTSKGVELEVLVFDDHSEDATAAIVRRLAECDARVRLLNGPELPDGWCGKQHACWVLAQKRVV